MNRLTKALFALLVLNSNLSGITAQTAIPASGGNAGGEGGTTAFSVGQVAFTNFKSGSGEINLGVQQVYLTVMVANEVPESDAFVNLYPNPVQNELHLSLSPFLTDPSYEDCSFRFYDLSGRHLMQGNAKSQVTTISLEDIAEGVYFMEISLKGNTVKTFKVIKTN